MSKLVRSEDGTINGLWCLQYTDASATIEDARAVMFHLLAQQGSFAGRTYCDGNGSTVAQVFAVDDAGEYGQWLPDGVRRVFLLASTARAWFPGIDLSRVGRCDHGPFVAGVPSLPAGGENLNHHPLP